MRPSPRTTAARPRADSPRPITPEGHFRTGFPSIYDHNDIQYFSEEELQRLETKKPSLQQARLKERLMRIQSETKTPELTVPSKPITSSTENLFRIFSSKNETNFKAVSPPPLSHGCNYTPVTTTDFDDENIGMSI